MLSIQELNVIKSMSQIDTATAHIEIPLYIYLMNGCHLYENFGVNNFESRIFIVKGKCRFEFAPSMASPLFMLTFFFFSLST